MTSDQECAQWTAALALAYSEESTTADRIALLNEFYHRARRDGVLEGIDRLKERLMGTSLEVPVLKGLQRQAG